jgi:hypothetical protein
MVLRMPVDRMSLAWFGHMQKIGTHIFGLVIMRNKTLQEYVFRLRSDEYKRGYTSGHIDGVIAGHSAQWHDGYNQGTRTQNAIDIMNRTVRLHDNRVTSIRGLLNILRDTVGLMKLKDEQIVLLQNKVASLQGIIQMLEQEVEDV